MTGSVCPLERCGAASEKGKLCDFHTGIAQEMFRCARHDRDGIDLIPDATLVEFRRHILPYIKKRAPFYKRGWLWLLGIIIDANISKRQRARKMANTYIYPKRGPARWS